MNSSELNEAFRSGLGTELSRKFSDDDVWRIADNAYRSFVRLTGGIPDFSSPATEVAVTAGEPVSALSPLVLRILRMTRRSDSGDVTIVNQTDVSAMTQSDYGRVKQLMLDNKRGPVRFAMIGMEKNKVRWISVPEVDDVVDMMIYRLPQTRIFEDGQELDEVEEQHHYALLNKMNALAAATPLVANAGGATAYEQAFGDYCAQVRAEMNRYKAKPVRTVSYGGL